MIWHLPIRGDAIRRSWQVFLGRYGGTALTPFPGHPHDTTRVGVHADAPSAILSALLRQSHGDGTAASGRGTCGPPLRGGAGVCYPSCRRSAHPTVGASRGRGLRGTLRRPVRALGAVSLRYLGAIPGYWVRASGPMLVNAVCGAGGDSVCTEEPRRATRAGVPRQRDSRQALCYTLRRVPRRAGTPPATGIAAEHEIRGVLGCWCFWDQERLGSQQADTISRAI
jgi:hypothetical protein